MRVIIKGGIWKNTEDEILKAAVMKYGKMQWARVASLLSRKSAAQCKARWYEWLDPSIKKTEWSRAEEERLLHLAKLLAPQWRTIASVVGRTAAQCLEHYEELIDQAQGGAAVDPKDDPRRLRPGEIDPQPETKPARPDPVDMDEDEKEMLSEARARLANTRGKKAKRKVREKALEDARRLAAVQKRRELKAAGIISGGRSRKRRRGIDYAHEIPFEKKAPAGFYDTTEEDVEAAEIGDKHRNHFDPIALNKLEEKRRDDEEKKNRNKDKQKFKKLAAMNLPRAIEDVSKLNDPSNMRKRSRLSLPAPQVSDHELEDIVKAGAAGSLLTDGGSSATHGLIGAYAAATPTPMRTPQGVGGKDLIMEEARNIIALNTASNPLMGGDQPILTEGMGFDGIAPKSSVSATPNVLFGRGRGGGGGGVGATPLPGATPAMTPGRTALRDEFGINSESSLMEYTPAATPLALRGGKKHRGPSELVSSLSALPQPQFTYEFGMPELEPEVGGEEVLKPDAAELDEKAAALAAAAAAAEEARKSAALRRDPPLPRPQTVSSSAIASVGEDIPDAAIRAADKAIANEMYALLKHDGIRWPVKGSKASKKRPKKVSLPPITDEEKAAAAALLEEEEARLRVVYESRYGVPDLAELQAQATTAAYSAVLVDGQVSLAGDNPSLRLAAAKARFEAIQAILAKEEKRAEKLQKKLTVITAGYLNRDAALNAQVGKLATDLNSNLIQRECFARLEIVEQAALPDRMEVVTRTYEREAEAERVAQQKYAAMMAELSEAMTS